MQLTYSVGSIKLTKEQHRNPDKEDKHSLNGLQEQQQHLQLMTAQKYPLSSSSKHTRDWTWVRLKPFTDQISELSQSQGK